MVFLVAVILVIGAVAALATGRITGGLGVPAVSLPEPFAGASQRPGPGEPWVTGADLESVRLSPALRGYRMDQVDDLLDRVRAEFTRRELLWLQATEQVPAFQQFVIAAAPRLADDRPVTWLPPAFGVVLDDERSEPQP